MLCSSLAGSTHKTHLFHKHSAVVGNLWVARKARTGCFIVCLLRWSDRRMKWKEGGQSNSPVFFFTFMGPCIVKVFKQDQHDTTLHNGIYCCNALQQRFSNFFQVGTTFISQNVGPPYSWDYQTH